MKNLLLIEEEAILGFGRKESQGTNNPSNTFIFFDLNVLTPKFLKQKKIVGLKFWVISFHGTYETKSNEHVLIRFNGKTMESGCA